MNEIQRAAAGFRSNEAIQALGREAQAAGIAGDGVIVSFLQIDAVALSGALAARLDARADQDLLAAPRM